jgi:hypothetical protein
VCGLALAHVDAAITDLAGVCASGGRLVVSVMHPFEAFLLGTPARLRTTKSRSFVREHTHTHAEICQLPARSCVVRHRVQPELSAVEVEP